jgi:rhodanese-related sulfurtransferase
MRVLPLSLRSSLLFAVLVALIAACSGSQVSAADDIDVREALARQEAGGVLLDVRTVGEYQVGHAVGAHLVPWVDGSGRMNPDFFAQVGTLASPDQEVLVICQSGNRSVPAARALRERGYHAAVNVLGGSMAWHRRGLPWEAGR